MSQNNSKCPTDNETCIRFGEALGKQKHRDTQLKHDRPKSRNCMAKSLEIGTENTSKIHQSFIEKVGGNEKGGKS